MIERAAAFASIFPTFEGCLDPNGAAFCRRCHETDPAVYRTRLAAVGLDGDGAVLDAGCGYGQWALTLAETYARVAAVDVAPERLAFLRQMAAATGASQLEARWGSLDALPFADASFDALLCYQALFTSRWRVALDEFARVLRPGGRLYFNANGPGWYLHLWHTPHNAAANYDPREIAARAFSNTIRYEQHGTAPDGPLIIDRAEAVAALEAGGFVDVQTGGDGTLTVRDDVEPTPFFAGELYGTDGVWEALATKG